MLIELTLIEISSEKIVKKQKMLVNPAQIAWVIVFSGDAQTGHTALYMAHPGDNQVLVDEPYNTVKAKLQA